MANRSTMPFRFNPRSVVDALDGGQVAPGGCALLTNLIFDPVNPFALQCRPAALKQTDFSSLTTPGFVSVAYIVGDICYGMIKSGAVATYDQPFAYNLATNSLVTVSGTQSSATLPLTQSSSGAWTPPTMALVGVNLIVTHPGFIGGMSAFFGWFDTTNPAAPVWHAGNTTTNLLPSVPTAVAQFNNRAWFALGNVLGFTDTLAFSISDATNFLTMNDINVITALAPLSQTTSVQGGIQSLAAFGEHAITVITGDAAFNNLADNTISTSVGTLSARGIANTDKGLMFPANDGIRTLGVDSTLSEPNTDLKVLFIFSVEPTRISASYNNNIYRITSQNGLALGTPKQEYWFDFRSNGWTGPHTFVQDMVVPYSETFVAFDSGNAPALYISDVVATGSSTFTELGSALNFTFRTAPMQDDGGLFQGTSTLSVLDLQLPHVNQSYTFSAFDVNQGLLSTAPLTVSSIGNIWDGFNWSNDTWTANTYGLSRYNIPWTNPLTFTRLIFQMYGPSNLNFKVGKLTVGYEPTRYVRNSLAVGTLSPPPPSPSPTPPPLPPSPTPVPNNPWNIHTMTYSGLSYTTSNAGPYLAISSDGKKMFTNQGGTGIIFQYRLGTDYDISTIQLGIVNGSTHTTFGAPYIKFSFDGLNAYSINTAGNHIQQQTLSTAWDLSTISGVVHTMSVNTVGYIYGIVFSVDGKHLYLHNAFGNVEQYTLGTAWDISTSSFVQQFALGAGDDGAAISPDGKTYITSTHISENVDVYTLGTAWDISTATHTTNLGSLNPPVTSSSAYDISVSVDGTKLYTMDSSSNIIYEYYLT